MQQKQNHLSKDAERLLRANGVDPATLRSNDAKQLLKGLNQQDAAGINRLLNNKAELERVLNSDAAKQIMQQLFGAGGAK